MSYEDVTATYDVIWSLYVSKDVDVSERDDS
jgi:hypothetical protein